MLREPPFSTFQPYLKILALILVMIITFLVVLALGVGISLPFFGKGLITGPEAFADYTDPKTVAMLKYLQIVNQFGAFILPAIIFVILTDNNFRAYLKIQEGPRRFSLVLGCVLLVVSLPFVGWLLEVNNRIALPDFLSGVEDWMRRSEESAQQLTDAFLATSSWTGFLVNLFMIAVLAAVGEELIFRGLLQRLFQEWTRSTHLAVIISALIFSAFHLQFYGFFGRFVLGLILGYLFVWTNSLWVPIVVHFFNNAMAVVVSFLDSRGIINADLESFGTSSNYLVISGSFFLMVFTLIMIRYHENKIPERAKKGPGLL
jgi:membrane protease YdiL (CAAX protease family)